MSIPADADELENLGQNSEDIKMDQLSVDENS